MICDMRDVLSTLRRRWWSVPALLALFLAPLPSAAAVSNDPLLPEQWALDQIHAPAAWAASTGSGVRVGIVDTGVDLAHEDLVGKVVAHTSCIGSGGDPAACRGSGQDDEGHGTHVAGIVAAARDNGKGVAGVAPDAQLVVAKALDSAGSGTEEDINAAIRWVVDHDAKVVNLSLGDPVFVLPSLFGTALREGIDYAWAHGAVPVLASGNANLLGLGVGSSNYGYLSAIVVGATDRRDRVADYSSPTGTAKWALLAPGGAGTGKPATDVVSTYWEVGEANQYEPLAGTSVSVPHVSGGVALLLAEGLTPQQAVDRILQTVDRRVACGPNSPTCQGRLDVARALGTEVDQGVDSSAPTTGLSPVEAVTSLLGGLLG